MVTVPCDGCTACCRTGNAHPDIGAYLRPGDDYSRYMCVASVNPITGKKGVRLQKTDSGNCVYLSPAGCTIYATRPQCCVEFDCRNLWLRFDGAQRDKMLSSKLMPPGVLGAGHDRLDRE